MCPRLDMYIRDRRNISRQKAQELIASGCVYVNGRTCLKPSLKVGENDNVRISEENKVLKYVGRGGYKLEKACISFGISLLDKICIDIGASTGGFTDCMLQNGAAKVYSVDVGSSQLADSLKNDSRVISLENTDIRNADIEKADFIGCDVSFISLKHILPHIRRLLKKDGMSVVLVKPQFEAGRSALNKKGIITEPSIHKKVLKDTAKAAEEEGFYVNAITYSPIKGGDGNIEYLMLLSRHEGAADIDMAEKTVQQAFENYR